LTESEDSATKSTNLGGAKSRPGINGVLTGGLTIGAKVAGFFVGAATDTGALKKGAAVGATLGTGADEGAALEIGADVGTDLGTGVTLGTGGETCDAFGAGAAGAGTMGEGTMGARAIGEAMGAEAMGDVGGTGVLQPLGSKRQMYCNKQDHCH
jgi:hypothetical protein